MGVGDGRVQGNLACLIEFDLVPVGGVLGQGEQGGVDVLQNPAKAPVQHQRIVGHAGTGGVVVDRVNPAALDEKFGIVPVKLLVQLVGAVVGGLALPELVDLLQQFLGFLGDAQLAQRGHLDGVEFVLDPVDLPFRIRVHGCGCAADGADDEVPVEEDVLVEQNLFEQLGADAEYAFALAFFIGIHEELEALGVHLLRRVQKEVLVGRDPLFRGIPIDGVGHGVYLLI